jgi:hypothetical protein
MSLKFDILKAVADRLETIKTANAYPVEFKKVYYDQIPMGINLSSYQLPVIFLIDGNDNLKLEMSCVEGSWDLRVVVWSEEKDTDEDMMNYARAIFKCIYANSPTAEISTAFRALHPSLVEMQPVAINPDLNMIKANRAIEVMFNVRYRTKLYAL